MLNLLAGHLKLLVGLLIFSMILAAVSLNLRKVDYMMIIGFYNYLVGWWAYFLIFSVWNFSDQNDQQSKAYFLVD